MVINKAQVGGAPSSLRRVHRGLALRELLISGEISRTGLAKRLGLSQMAASRIVRELIAARLVGESGLSSRESGPGRYQTLLRIREDGAYAAGIAFSATVAEVSIVSAAGRQIAHKTVSIGRYTNGEKVLTRLGNEVVRLIEEANLPKKRIIGVGVVVAGILDAERHRVVNADYLGLEAFDITEPVARATGLPVIAENITNALALAESCLGVSKDAQNVIVVRSATSVGATVMQRGEIIRGHDHRAGRLGHARLRRTKLVCSCGRCDCLNCSGSGWSVLVNHGLIEDQRYRPEYVQRYSDAINQMLEQTAGSAAQQTSLARRLGRAGAALADVVHSYSQIVDPQAIILAGSMARSQSYVDGVTRRLRELDDEGQSTVAKLRIGEMRGGRAAGILVLLQKIYSPSLDIEQFNALAGVDRDVV